METKNIIKSMSKGTLVNNKGLVTVFGTGLSKHLPEGKESGKINKIAADKLVASGKATYEQGVTSGKGKGKGKGKDAEDLNA